MISIRTSALLPWEVFVLTREKLISETSETDFLRRIRQLTTWNYQKSSHAFEEQEPSDCADFQLLKFIKLTFISHLSKEKSFHDCLKQLKNDLWKEKITQFFGAGLKARSTSNLRFFHSSNSGMNQILILAYS